MNYRFGTQNTNPINWTMRLVLINVVVFVLSLLMTRTPLGSRIFTELWLLPEAVLRGHIWQLFTYMFLHDLGGFQHILFNMFLLWMMGREVEYNLGSANFLKIYFAAGLVAGLCSMFSSSPVLGASGAVLGILAAYGFLFPDRKILVMFVFPMKVRYFIWLVAAIDIMGAISGTGNIAHMAHIGGLFTGLLLMRTGWYRKGFDTGEWRRRQELERKQRMQQRVNEILDKVNEQGIGSLSRQEREFLEKIRRD